MPQLRRLALSDSSEEQGIHFQLVHIEIVDEIILVYDSLIELHSTPVGIISLLLPLIPAMSGRKKKRRPSGASRG